MKLSQKPCSFPEVLGHAFLPKGLVRLMAQA